jgi:hypothetical protein
MIDINSIRANFVDTFPPFHLQIEKVPASKTLCAVQNTRNLSACEKQSLYIKAFISQYETEMVGGKIYHVLHVDKEHLARCEILTAELLRFKISGILRHVNW